MAKILKFEGDRKIVNVDVLKEYEFNNKKHGAKQLGLLADSIVQEGYLDEILVNKEMVIIAGHGRLEAIRNGGYDEVEVKVISPNNERKLRLMHNKIAALAEDDITAIEFELDELDDPELNELYEYEPLSLDPEQEEIEDDVPEAGKLVVELGDIYQLGEHRILCGDSTKIEETEKLMDGLKVDILVTDPPYNVDYVGKTKDSLTIQNDSMSNDQFRQFLVDAFSSCDAVMKPGAAFYIWHADSEGFNFRGACQDNEWQIRQCLIWNKASLVMGRQDYHWKHEPCLYGWKAGASHTWTNDRKQTTVMEFAKPNKNPDHPTMKPVEIIQYLIGNNSKQKDIVLDTFLGSGSTLIAAEKLGRVCYGMELDPVYIQVVIKRYHKYTKGKKDIKCLNREIDLTQIYEGA